MANSQIEEFDENPFGYDGQDQLRPLPSPATAVHSFTKGDVGKRVIVEGYEVSEICIFHQSSCYCFSLKIELHPLISLFFFSLPATSNNMLPTHTPISLTIAVTGQRENCVCWTT